MCKKLVFVCLVILAITSYAQAADVLIGTWEGDPPGNEGWQDHPLLEARGWTSAPVDDPELMPSRYVFSDEWSSDGEKSLRANVTGWSWFERVDVHALWYDHSTIEFDLYAVAQPGSSATWAQVEKMAGSTYTNGWFDIPEAQFNIGLGGAGTHCVFDYAAAGYRTSTYFGPADPYGSIIIAYNAAAPVYMYIDNVKLTGVPEPATMTLLGLGALALLRRKR